MTSLEGIHGLKGVRRFEIHQSRNLATLDGIANVGAELEEVLIATCGKLKDTGALRSLPNLKWAILDGHDLLT